LPREFVPSLSLAVGLSLLVGAPAAISLSFGAPAPNMLGCGRAAPRESAASAPAPQASVAPVASARRPTQEPLADERVEIPGGSFFAGSTPGEPGRKPDLEPRRYKIELGPFQIDRLPYPNDPKKPALTNVPREEARRLCAERGARLCTELEWERACKGTESELFAGATSWDPRCATEPNACASGFDTLAMGAALREWTASSVIFAEADRPRRAAVRGAAAAAPAHEHRCAQRVGIDPDTTSADLGFRCCKGAPNAAVVPEPKLDQTFRRAKIGADRLSRLLAADPRTQKLAKDVKFFREPDAANTVVERGPGDKKGFTFTVAPLLWNPVAGAEYLVLSARSGEDTSFVVAYYVVGDDDYRLASSFVMNKEAGPVALAYDGYIRPRLHFSTCWGCPGESGKILYREPDAVAIVQP
jgi:hypothetical protein